MAASEHYVSIGNLSLSHAEAIALADNIIDALEGVQG
ncbi:hypothetical protein ABH922_000907 [Rhodococcus sp. 27YEA15]